MLFQGNFDEFVMDVVKMRTFVMLVLAFDLISQELHLNLSIVHLQFVLNSCVKCN